MKAYWLKGIDPFHRLVMMLRASGETAPLFGSYVIDSQNAEERRKRIEERARMLGYTIHSNNDDMENSNA